MKSRHPKYKVYSADGEYRAACHHVEDAAAIVATLEVGATIRLGHARKHTVWTEGTEAQPAAESYDYVAETVDDRATAMVLAAARDLQRKEKARESDD